MPFFGAKIVVPIDPILDRSTGRSFLFKTRQLLSINNSYLSWSSLLLIRNREEQQERKLINSACLKMDLITAVETNNLERVRLLVEQGADKDQRDEDGCTPLYWASVQGRLEAAQYLVEQGSTLDKATDSGETPLSRATIHGHLELARYLLEQGADRDKACNSGWTPLHLAACSGHLEIAMLLMSYGADLNARNNRGQLPIDVGLRSTEEIRQAIRNEPRRRMDEAPGKRATEQDRHPNIATSASLQQEEAQQEEGQSNKRSRLDDEEAAVVAEEETKIAEEDEDSEPSSDEGDN